MVDATQRTTGVAPTPFRVGKLALEIDRVMRERLLPSGRVRVDVARGLNEIDDPAASNRATDYAQDPQTDSTPDDAVALVVAAAVRAPSGGNFAGGADRVV